MSRRQPNYLATHSSKEFAPAAKLPAQLGAKGQEVMTSIFGHQKPARARRSRASEAVEVELIVLLDN